MIGIWGPPGIGKTTIARFLFHQLSSRFQLRAIMLNMKANYPIHHLDDSGAQEKLQHQMLLKISNQKEVPNLELALNGLRDKKVLLVLDNVDCIELVHALAKEIGWFGPGSCIIITTENLRLLEAQGINHIYKVKPPSSDEAFKIFCMYAFGKEYPDDGFHDLAWKVTNLAGSLPLGLKFLGSALRNMSKEEWKRALPLLKTRLIDGKIESIIKFSYDALHDEEKDLFLYIACLFTVHYFTTHRVEELLAKKFWNVKQSVHTLVKKSFIYIEDGHFKAHALLEQFGRETSRKQVKRELLINARDLCDDTIDCSKLIGIKLNLSHGLNSEELNELDIGIQLKYEKLNINEKAVERMSDVQFVDIVEREYGVAPCKRLHSLLYHSQKIRLLNWNYIQNKSLPSTFNPEYLVDLQMRASKLQKLWEGNKPLKNLKFMSLGDSHDLKELPDLSTATNLKYLVIDGCSNLRKLRKFRLSNSLVSPQLSDSLNYIYAEDCKSLERLDCSFNNPNILLIFINCFKLNKEARDLIMHTPTNRYAVLPGKQVPNINIMVKNKRLEIYAKTEHIYTFEVEVSEVTSNELVFEFKTDSSDWKVGKCGLLQILEVPIKGRIGKFFSLTYLRKHKRWRKK